MFEHVPIGSADVDAGRGEGKGGPIGEMELIEGFLQSCPEGDARRCELVLYRFAKFYRGRRRTALSAPLVKSDRVDVLGYLRSERRSRAPVAWARAELQVLASFYDFAISRGVADCNPAAGIEVERDVLGIVAASGDDGADAAIELAVSEVERVAAGDDHDAANVGCDDGGESAGPTVSMDADHAATVKRPAVDEDELVSRFLLTRPEGQARRDEGVLSRMVVARGKALLAMTRADVLQFLRGMGTAARARKTMVNSLGTLRAFYRFLHQTGAGSANPAQGIDIERDVVGDAGDGEVNAEKMDEATLTSRWLYNRCDNTKCTYARLLREFRDSLGNESLATARFDHVAAFLDSFRRRGLSEGTVNTALYALKSFYDFAQRIGQLTDNPAWSIKGKTPKNTLSERIPSREEIAALMRGCARHVARERRFLRTISLLRQLRTQGLSFRETAMELNRLGHLGHDGLPWMENSISVYENFKGQAFRHAVRDRIIVWLLYFGAFRISELVGLRWKDVREGANGHGQVTTFGKGDKTRVVVIPRFVYRRLMLYRARMKGQDDQFLVWSRVRENIDSRQIRRILHNVARRSGVRTNISPHMLRHSHASHSLDLGTPIHVVQQTLGHSSLLTTQRYVHARPGSSSGLSLGRPDREHAAV